MRIAFLINSNQRNQQSSADAIQLLKYRHEYKNVFTILMVSKIWKVTEIGAWKPTSFIFYLLMCDNIWILCYILCLIIITMKSDRSISNISSKSNISSERNRIAFFNVNINLCNCDSRACYIFQLFVLFVLFEIQLINLIHCYKKNRSIRSHSSKERIFILGNFLLKSCVKIILVKFELLIHSLNIYYLNI